MSFPESIVVALAALILEGLFGYPDWLYRAVGHPVTWIGHAISFGDRHLNRAELPKEDRRARGWWLMGALLATTLFVSVLIAGRAGETIAGVVIIALCASTLVAQRSLHAHVRDVADALDHSLAEGRASVARIVGRDVEGLDEAGVARAAIESLAENFSDGVVAPTFWLALFGLPGAALYKVINTADSMIGHRTARYANFGFAAAKIDDAANWPAARAAGALIVAASAIGWKSSAPEAWRIMRRDAMKHASPNSGWPEAAMAGALGVRLGGPRAYGGVATAGAWFGSGDAPVDRTTIRRALAIYRRALALQFAALLAIFALLLL
jgi:adenosylcobinamide-phosphate synthase